MFFKGSAAKKFPAETKLKAIKIFLNIKNIRKNY
jgi:hypothetical protein